MSSIEIVLLLKNNTLKQKVIKITGRDQFLLEVMSMLSYLSDEPINEKGVSYMNYIEI